MTWTTFWDMHSGGRLKEPYERIHIEAPLKEAKLIFYNRFGHNPERVSCTCCGDDYSIDEDETLEEASKFHRFKNGWDNKDGSYTLEEYEQLDNNLIIRASEIKDEEREGYLPEEGYIWH